MVRELIVHDHLAVDATFTAGKELKTGMGVVRDFTTRTATTPSAATAAQIAVVYKLPIPTGRNAALTQFSDYDEELNTVAKGEKFVCYTYPDNTEFAVDQYAAALKESDVDKYLEVGTDGLWTVAAKSANSRYKFIGFMNDNGHTLAKIFVCDVPGANA